MLKRLLSVVVLGVAVVSAASIATGATQHHATKHSLNGRVKLTNLENKGNPPAPGSSQTTAGRVATPQGSGAIIGTIKYGVAASFTGTQKAFFDLGAFKLNIKGTGTPNSDGSVSFKGSGRVVGGTGRYGGAHGSFTLSGKVHQFGPGGVVTFIVKGSVVY
jgi:hypothetical protein